MELKVVLGEGSIKNSCSIGENDSPPLKNGLKIITDRGATVRATMRKMASYSKVSQTKFNQKPKSKIR